MRLYRHQQIRPGAISQQLEWDLGDQRLPMLIERRAEAQFAKAEHRPAGQRRRHRDADPPIRSAALAHMQRDMIVFQLLLGEQRIVLAAAPGSAKRRLWRKHAMEKRAWQLKTKPDQAR